MTAINTQVPLITPGGSELTYSPALDRTVKLFIVIVVTLLASMEFPHQLRDQRRAARHSRRSCRLLRRGSWIITTYMSCFLIALMMSSWLVANIGYRRYTAIAVIAFMLSAVGCALSHTLPQMLVLRGIMGFAGGGFLSRGQAAIYLTHTGKARLGALTVFALGVLTARTVSPALGGYLTEWYSWRYVFLLNVPLALTALVLLVAFLPDVKDKDVCPRLDVAGLLLLIGWVAPLQIFLEPRRAR
jgi:DHA2 family multidrug resistance protein